MYCVIEKSGESIVGAVLCCVVRTAMFQQISHKEQKLLKLKAGQMELSLNNFNEH